VSTVPAVPPERKPLTILCVLAVLALLYATLWPFDRHPHNGVSWLPGANGIRFTEAGIVLSDGALQAVQGADSGDSCAIEIYLRSIAQDDAGNFLTFSSDGDPDAIFLRQWHESLLINRATHPHWHTPGVILFEVDDVLRHNQLVLVTISSGSDGTVLYIDGKVAGKDPNFRIRRSELYRQVVLGMSPSTFDDWKGEVHGLAIYSQEVSPAGAAAHYAQWTGTSASGDQDINVLARYDFRQRGGSVIHSDVASAPALLIPVHFFIPRKSMLTPVGDQFEWTANWRQDVLQNIIGFMPLGFVLCGLFALSRPRAQAVLLATLSGGFLSFTIEFLQFYIPRRDSGWTDVITNSTGTLLGALIAYPELVRAALRLVHLIPPKRNGDTDPSGEASQA
jgi:VanZ family protein